jgi:hypothetical protein
VIVGLPSGQGVFVACEDATPINAIEAPRFEGEAGLELWPRIRLRLSTAAQRLRVLLLDAPIGFQPGWGMSWVSDACALSLPDDTAQTVLARLAEAGVHAVGVSARGHEISSDDTPSPTVSRVRWWWCGSTPRSILRALDDLAAALRSAVAG